MKSGNLNFLEPSGPLQAYNGTALPFILFQMFKSILKRFSSLKALKVNWEPKNKLSDYNLSLYRPAMKAVSTFAAHFYSLCTLQSDIKPTN
jgi:hypothetical protein